MPLAVKQFTWKLEGRFNEKFGLDGLSGDTNGVHIGTAKVKGDA